MTDEERDSEGIITLIDPPPKPLSTKDKIKEIKKALRATDFSYDEISNTLNISLGAVKSRLHRARRTLAQSWADRPKQNLNTERKYHESPAL